MDENERVSSTARHNSKLPLLFVRPTFVGSHFATRVSLRKLLRLQSGVPVHNRAMNDEKKNYRYRCPTLVCFRIPAQSTLFDRSEIMKDMLPISQKCIFLIFLIYIIVIMYLYMKTIND